MFHCCSGNDCSDGLCCSAFFTNYFAQITFTDFELIYNETEPGLLKTGLYSPYEINDAGRVLEFIFKADASIDLETVISLERFQVNNEVIQQATAVVSIHSPAEIPTEFVLYQNYPNPFNPSTVIPYNLPQTGNVSITLYNLLGQKIITLFNGFKQAGFHEFKWNGKNEHGVEVAGGIYICETTFSNQRNTIKIIKLH